jgi:ParB family transcriptional regulator, chromosome partitioning protein
VSKVTPGMGRGLQAILSSSAALREAPEHELRELPVDLIAPNPNQPRRHFDEETLQGLATSVQERGVLQPVLVRRRPGGSYELLAGERRWRAARIAGLETIPAVIGEHEDAESLELGLIENMVRDDLNPIEEARACAALVEEFGVAREDVARRIGRSRSALSNLTRLLDLPEDVLELIERGSLSEGHGRALLMAEDHAARRSLARLAVGESWTVRHTEDRARASNSAWTGKGAPPRRRITDPHPDREHAAQLAAESLSAALGTEVRVRHMSDGTLRVQMRFASPSDAIALAHRLSPATRDS